MKRFLLLLFFSVICLSCDRIDNDNQYLNSTVSAEMRPTTEIQGLPLTKVQETYVLNSSSFGLELLTHILQNRQNEGFVYSPLSLQYLVGMLSNIVDAESQEKMIKAVYATDCKSSDLNSYLRILINYLPALDLNTTISIANIMLLSNIFDFNNSGFDIIEDNYQALTCCVDFTDKSLPRHINTWISNHTNGLIDNMVSEAFTTSTVTFTANSSYFSAPWAVPFNKAITKSSEFTSIENKKTNVSMMESTDIYNYYEDTDLQLVEIPYGNGKFVMDIILPKHNDLQETITLLKDNMWNSYKSNISKTLVNVFLPSFELVTSLDMKQLMVSAGWNFMNTYIILDSHSGGNAGLEKILQKTSISVGEYGTKVSSASSGESEIDWGIGDADITPKLFNADHPFIFIISDVKSDVILFAGAYTGK